MKRVLQLLIVLISLTTTLLPAWGVVLPKHYKIKLQNLEYFNPNVQPQSGPFADGIEDIWGIADVTQIFNYDDPLAPPVWKEGDNGEHIRIIFWGLDLKSWTGDPGGFTSSTARVTVDGRTIPYAGADMWLWNDKLPGYIPLNETGGPGMRSDYNRYPSISDSNAGLLAKFRYMPGIDSTLSLTVGNTFGVGLPPTGQGAGYLDAIPDSGSLANSIDTNGLSTAAGSRDVYFQVNFRKYPDLGQPDFGWSLSSEDPIIGYATNCFGKIGDFVWNDLNRNGIQDAGEPGIPGVKVSLLNTTTNATIQTVTTGANGDYLFKGLCAGSYRVVVDASTLPPGVMPTPGNIGPDRTVDSNGSPADVTLLTDNSSDLTVDFGYNLPCTGKIGDLVWHDLNRNGLQDNGEPGIVGVAVTLKDASGSTTIASTTTNANGFYGFSGLCAGTYTVEATTPAGYTPSPSLVGTDRAVDSNGSPTTVVLATDNSVDSSIDFGFNTPCTGTIGDLAWYDQNRNGLQDAGEPGIAGVTVVLLNASGATIATTSTGADGKYSFSGLCSGSYTVEVTTPTGYLPAPTGVGSDRAIDSNGSPAPVTLPTDTNSDLTIDFGFVSPCTGSIGDLVWHDLNRNGIQDPAEPGLNGVKLNLLDASGSVIQTTITATIAGRDGTYSFNGLCPGSYTVAVDASTLPVGYTPTTTNAPDSDFTNDSNGTPSSVSLAEGEKNPTIDFGYVNPCTGSIGDFVWHDLNRNGIQDDVNTGIDGVTVTLTYPDGTIKSTTTANGGLYQFTGLCAGNYTVLVDSGTLPPGYTPTTSNAPGSTAANDSNGSPSFVNLPDDFTNNLTIDFGYLSPCADTIGDFVWNDLNKNGIQDTGEPGISGVTVLLKTPADNATIATTTTDSSGLYQFRGLCAGSYKVEVNMSTLPAGFVATIPNAAGSTPANDSNGSPAVVTLPIDANDTTIDFGYYMVTGQGCSLTWGYWKTHSEFGPAPYDKTWAKLPKGASTPFYISGQTYYQVLLSDPKGGNAYYILAHQYIAAYLNSLNGADVSVISSQLTQAEVLFKVYKPSDKLTGPVRETFVSLAYVLDQYNNGNIGPGHCKDSSGSCSDGSQRKH